MNSTYYIHYDRIHIHGANAISGQIIYGFPALNGFLGALHALERRLHHDKIPLSGGHKPQFSGLLIACHRHRLQSYCAPYHDLTFNQSRNPPDKNGANAAIIEEGKIHLTVSLVVRASGDHFTVQAHKEALAAELQNALSQQRLAGGSITDIAATRIYGGEETAALKAALYPAYILRDAGDELAAITAELRSGKRADGSDSGYPPQPQANALDALLSIAQTSYIPQPENLEEPWRYHNYKSGRGWLVPLSVGYQAISPACPPGALKNTRNPDYPAQYVENLYSLGRWDFPHRLPDDLGGCFWHYAANHPNHYLISQN